MLRPHVCTYSCRDARNDAQSSPITAPPAAFCVINFLPRTDAQRRASNLGPADKRESPLEPIVERIIETKNGFYQPLIGCSPLAGLAQIP
jgi:hypothetical protein